MDKWKEERRDNTQMAAAALSERLRLFFEEQAPRERAIKISVDAGEQQTESDSQETYSTVTFVLPDGTLLEGFYRISNVGGNMYTVEAGVRDRSAEFSFSLPDASAAAEETYGKAVCEYLLEEIERQTGEMRLRETTHR
jgi:hypothetical protein